MTLTHAADRAKKRTTAELHTDALTSRMIGLAEAVTTCPQAFTEHHAAKLRNAAQVAVSAAELIALEIENARTRHTG
jgi:hypothetical protein